MGRVASKDMSYSLRRVTLLTRSLQRCLKPLPPLRALGARCGAPVWHHQAGTICATGCRQLSVESRTQDAAVRGSGHPSGPSNKLWRSAEEALDGVLPGDTILSSGFGLCGTAETLIAAIQGRPDLRDLTVVSNNAGTSDRGGLAPLIISGQISKMIMSYVGSNKRLQDAYLGGEIDLELSPQGTLAERLRAAGVGVPFVLSRTGAGTFVETGEIPQRYSISDGQRTVSIPGIKKRVMEHEGVRYLYEPAITGDVAILRAWKVDKAGNCIFRYTTRSFSGLCARAARLTIVEAENIVDIGELDPMEIDLPGIYVDRIVPATVGKEVEIVKVHRAGQESNSQSDTISPRERIARRAAKELKDGAYCNLGVGIPTLAASYLPADRHVWLQSENGILGMGRYPTEDEIDADIINAGKETVTLQPGASVFDSAESFGMIRGGHVDTSMLGAMEVSSSGDLANYMIPGKLVKGMGGAMDLVSNPDKTQIIVVTEHVDKYGKPKIVDQCSLPLTGVRCVSRVITDLAVFDVDRKEGGLTLIELAEGTTREAVKEKTGCDFAVADEVSYY